MPTVYLDYTLGDDSRTYAQAQNSATPWKLPSKVYTSATTGDTCIIANGTYTTGLTLTCAKSINWVAQTNGSVIWDFGSSTGYYIHHNTASITTSFTGIKFINMKQNALYAAPFMCSILSGGTLNLTDCTIDTVEVSPLAGQDIGSVIGNYQGSWSVNLTRVLIKGVKYLISATNTNLFSSTGSAVYTLNNCTIYIDETTKPVAKFMGIMSTSTMTGKNNIIYFVTSTPWGSPSINTMTYSDGYGITSFPANTGNITSDPLFVDVPNGNYNLRPTSPCIDTGTTA